MKFAACAISLMLLAGCTMTPPVVTPSAPSLDAGVANSGVLALTPGHGAVVTRFFAERYAALVKLYGTRLIPPMTQPRWITPTTTNTFVITSDGLAAFALMDFYARQDQRP